MTAVLPPRFLFRFALSAPRADHLPGKSESRLLEFPEQSRLPDVASLDGAPGFAALRAAWNPGGLALSVEVRGKSAPPRCDPERPTTSDGLQVWIDTRCTQNVHRATRFCHYFCLLPTGGGKNGSVPVGVQLPVPRAREDAALCDPRDLRVVSEMRDNGYRLDAWLPASVLHGFDPESQPRLGFYYAVVDSELGTQVLSVGEDFPYSSDPSLWGVLELAVA
jgi:hypothetical protein